MKRKPFKHKQRSVEDIRLSPNCSIPEAVRLTGYTRHQIAKLLDDDEWEWFQEGQRKRIVVQSIFDYQERKVQERKAS